MAILDSESVVMTTSEGATANLSEMVPDSILFTPMVGEQLGEDG